MFYFNFIENTCVLNLRDIRDENLQLNIRLYYPNEAKVSCIELKEQILLNAFLLTKKGTILKSSGDASSADIEETPKKEENLSKPIQESNIVPPRAIRAAKHALGNIVVDEVVPETQTQLVV